MQILKRRLPERIIRRLTRHPVIVVSFASLSFRLGKDAMLVNKGEINGGEFRKRAGGHMGTLSGGLAGAAAGAAAGSVVPGLGTILGAFAGGMVGEHFGGRFGRVAVERAEVVFTNGGFRSQPPGGSTDRSGREPPKRHM